MSKRFLIKTIASIMLVLWAIVGQVLMAETVDHQEKMFITGVLIFVLSLIAILSQLGD